MSEETGGGSLSGDEQGSVWRWLALAGLVLIAAIAPVVVNARVFPNGSPDWDETAYIAQADNLREGRLTLPGETHEPFFRPFLSGYEDGEVVFKYQPAWPALIAISEAATGTPRTALALTGVASALAVAALALEVTRRRRAALLAGYVFACSPWFLIQSGTYLAYPASTALLCGATACLLRGVRKDSTWLLAATGALLGLAVFHRPYDAVVGALPALVWLLVTRGRTRELVRDMVRIAAGAVPFAALFFAYNLAVTGSLTKLAYSVAGPMDTFGFGDRSSLADPGQPGPYVFTPAKAWRTVTAFAGSLPDWLPGGLLVLVLAVLGFQAVARRSPASRRAAILVAAQGLIFVPGYFIWWGASNARSYRLHLLLGPLYWFPLLAAVAVLGGAGIDRLASSRPGFLRRVPGAAIAVLTVAVLVLASAATSDDTRDELRRAMDYQDHMVAQLGPGPGERSLVIAPRIFDGDLFVPVPVEPDLDADHLVAQDPTNGLRRFELFDRFGDDRTIAEVIEVHRPGKPFDQPDLVRRDLTVRSGPTVTVTAQPLLGGTPYVRLQGEDQPYEVVDGRVQVLLAAEPTEGAVVVPEGDPVTVVVGVDDFELHYLVRVVDGEVQVIEPPTPVRHYHFEGHDPVDMVEDVSSGIRPA